MKDFKYTTSFSSVIKPLVSEEKDKYLALASHVDIGDFVPDVNTDKNIDLLPIAFNAFVTNRVNKNGDAVDTDTAIAMYKDFINKPINIEHNRERVIGTILTAGFSEFGTDKPLTEEQVKEKNEPFNVTLGGVVWKVVNSDLADLIENSTDPDGDSYQRISASWELGFSEYNLALIQGESKNLEDAEIVSATQEVDELKSNLKSFGGTGTTEDGRSIYRKVINNVIPLGIGLTETPAAEVKGVHTKKKEEPEVVATEEEISEIEEKVEIKEEKISQTNNNNVKTDTSIAMKITNIQDITDENLKLLEASAVSEFIEDELKTASEKFAAEKLSVENALAEATEKHESLLKEHGEAKEQLEKVQAQLGELLAEKAQREAEERFNTNMAEIDEEFALEDEERNLIASDIKDMDDEAFSAYTEKLNVLLKSRKREVIEAEERKQAEEAEASQKEEQVASAQEVVEEAVENAEVQASEIPNSTDATEPTIFEKYKSAFSVDGFEIK
tara:strand:+ start:3578 stop:5080 length:1503 start_codon:yes stop_codon:yes gene_type:complete